MWSELLQTFLISISPLGEARVGIPYGMLQGQNPVLVYLTGMGANLLALPLFNWLLDSFDKKLWRFTWYRNRSVKLMRRAKAGVGASIKKYDFWGLMIFVMIPLPFTGAYMGVIAARVLNVHRSKAYRAIAIGVIISSTIIAATTYLGMLGVRLL
ncbi:MAG: ligand-binding protein SH3 [Sphingobacteriaceae bacterium]|nr:ligand-binding protein SH3 [Sphingobacteriaceae bacterium]